MIILRPVKHDCQPFKGVGIVRVGQITVAEFGADDAGFHDGCVEQVARQHQEACILDQRLVIRADDLLILYFHAPAIVAHGLAVDGHRAFMDQPLRDQLRHHSGNAPGAIIILAQIFACRLEIDQQGNLVPDALPILERQVDADMAGNRRQMNGRVGRSADGAVDHDGVVERISGQNVGWLEILMHHLDDALAGQIGGFLAIAIRGGNSGRTRQHHAQRLGKRVHGRCRPHGVAIAGRWRGRRDELDKAFIVDLARRQQLPRFPYDGAGPGALALVPAIQHRADGQGDGGNVDGRSRHQQRRRGLVAAGGQDHPVERIAVHRFDQPQIGKVAVQARRRALAGFLNRVDRKFQRDPAHFANTVAHAFGQHHMMAVAGRKVAAGLGNADDRLAAAQFLQAQPEIQIAFQIERCHVDIVGVVEPGATAQFEGWLGRITHWAS